jgi:hypothetical protein
MLKAAIPLSILYVVVAVSYAISLGTGLKGLQPNTFGDMLAGIFSPLAFFWFVLAVWMQRKELELQRTELASTREVLADQKAAQEESAKNLKESNLLTSDLVMFQTIEILLKSIDEMLLKARNLDFTNESGIFVRFAFSSNENGNIYPYPVKSTIENIRLASQDIKKTNIFPYDLNSSSYFFIECICDLIQNLDNVCGQGSKSLSGISVSLGYSQLKEALLKFRNLNLHH